MKRTIVMLAVAAGSMVAFAQPPSNPTPVQPPAQPAAPAPLSATVLSQPAPPVKKEGTQVPKIVVSTPLTKLGQPVFKYRSDRVDGMSSRPWAQTVGIHPGYSAFPPTEKHEPTMYLFWVGRDPY